MPNQLLIIGSGKWPETINSVLKSQEENIDISRIGARNFLKLGATEIAELTRGKCLWIATTLENQFKILLLIEKFDIKVILEKPFAINTLQLNELFLHNKNSKNVIYISEPWRHSFIWQALKTKLEGINGYIDIVIYRGGPSERKYITPVWDWLQHDLGLVSELISDGRDSTVISCNFASNQKTLEIKIKNGSRYNFEINVGFFSKRQETWHSNNVLLADFGDKSLFSDHPLYSMYRFVSHKNFVSNLEIQVWLTSRVIKAIDSTITF